MNSTGHRPALAGGLLDFDKIAVILFLFLILISCSKRNNESIEENIYKECIAVLLEYDKYYDTDLSISDTMTLCNEFVFAVNYLSAISDIKIEYDYSGIIPKVQNRNVLRKAINEWEKWWNENGSSLTHDKSDSIINSIDKSEMLINSELPLRLKKIMR